MRIDSTALECHINYATSSSLFEDGIRVITRLLIESQSLFLSKVTVAPSTPGSSQASRPSSTI